MTVQSTLSGLKRNMEQQKLKELVKAIKRLAEELESEIYSDTSKYLQQDNMKVSVEDDDGEAD